MQERERLSTSSDRSGVQVIRRVAQILEALRDEPNGLSLSQLAEKTGLARSTVHRIASALEEERFLVSASPQGRVRIGPALVRLAAASERSVVADFHPYLVQLARELDETVDLAILEDDQARFLDQIPATGRLRAVSAVGASFPVHCTANGKALLAALDDDEVGALLPTRLPKLTPSTITTRKELLAELAAIREQGVAYDREEHTLGISAIGIAVDNGSGRPLAISVPMPAQRFAGRERSVVEALLELRRSLELGPGASR